MAVITHSHELHSSAPTQSPHRRHVSAKRVCLGLVLLCVAIAALALPLVRDGLQLIQTQLHWPALSSWLAQAPMASWLMMFVWGALVPLSLIAMLRYHRNALGVVAALAFAAVAVIWYVHMPALSTCGALYQASIWCSVISWGYSLSLGISNAVYLFALVMALLGGISFAAIPEDDEQQDTGQQAAR
ncbi:hypothetical protein M2375_002139 [Comamonas sp. BIGb0152]|uniref:hypothetical protein n=1 Tax=Comamonas sp. BIGb0152 TaxID=2940601 RepID=UPI002168E483|nr:hypothetical protein [Comamonas sp. BIGb0152]MCS4293907.1 hypothetical protein [Comamonas sp. BIGb0152]